MSEKRRNVVTFERARRRPDPARVMEFAETARRLQREREQSADVVARLLRDTPREEWPRLATRPELRNSGALDRMEKEVAARLEKEPQEALLISDLAASIAETLPPDAYPPVVLAQLRAHAWKDRAQALAYVARNDEALAAIDRAEQHLAPFATLAHDRAVMWYVRATTLQQINRLTESRELLATCARVFHDHGDERLYLFCGIAEGILLYRQARFREAYDCFLPLIDVARGLGDVESEARLQNNLGYCAIEFGDLVSANIHLAEATARFVDAGKRVEAIRTDRATGRMFIGKGCIAEGMQRLRDARRLFLMHEMIEEAGLCGLDLVEVLLDSAPVEAATLAREVADQFLSHGLNHRAVIALGYLREAIEQSRASVATVEQVRSYITALATQPSLELQITF
jgi:tetratricopeptide (TPR) repeat protein